mmetsp:Transcript_18837/g.43656  ORF Transcript_18837/g.43656 Transcript_18837/m.43656 type:complete len:208 (+) Transcript_18837:270-893(+)
MRRGSQRGPVRLGGRQRSHRRHLSRQVLLRAGGLHPRSDHHRRRGFAIGTARCRRRRLGFFRGDLSEIRRRRRRGRRRHAGRRQGTGCQEAEDGLQRAQAHLEDRIDGGAKGGADGRPGRGDARERKRRREAGRSLQGEGSARRGGHGVNGGVGGAGDPAGGGGSARRIVVKHEISRRNFLLTTYFSLLESLSTCRFYCFCRHNINI